MPNPAYATTLTVRVWMTGNDITNLIVSEYERTNGALPTTAGATSGSTYKEVDNSNSKANT